MRITHSTAAERAARTASTRRSGLPSLELVALLVASVLSLATVWLVYRAKAAEVLPTATGATATVDLTTVDRAEQLLPVLEAVVTDPAERRFVADRITGWLTTPDGSGALRRRLLSVGSLALVRVSEADVKGNRRLMSFQQRLAERRRQVEAQTRQERDSTGTQPRPNDARGPRVQPGAISVPLLTAAQLSALRPALVVRAWPAFRNALLAM